jgi:hypothetical protein
MPNRDEEAKELARRHYAVEIGLKDIFVLRDTAVATIVRGGETAAGNDETIKLLEVNENTVPSGVVPIEFGPAPASGIHFSSVIVEVTPEEFQRIRNQELPLPNGWEIGEHVEKPQPAQE